MKIAILGATGLTGQQLVQQALDADHEVIAIVRTASKLQIEDERLTIVEGNIFCENDLKKHFQDVDVVMSTLGFGLYPRTVTGYSDAIKCAVKAMREVSCKRLIVMHSWFTHKDSRNDHITTPFFIRWILIPILRPVLDNMRETEEYLAAECEDIEYTVVLPPGLSNNPKTELEYEVVENGFSIPGANREISRADVARYMIKVVQDETLYQKICAIAVKS